MKPTLPRILQEPGNERQFFDFSPFEQIIIAESIHDLLTEIEEKLDSGKLTNERKLVYERDRLTVQRILNKFPGDILDQIK